MTSAVLYLLGLACTAWCAREIAQLAGSVRRRELASATNLRTGRPMGFRRDRRNGVRRSSDRRRAAAPGGTSA